MKGLVGWIIIGIIILAVMGMIVMSIEISGTEITLNFDWAGIADAVNASLP